MQQCPHPPSAPSPVNGRREIQRNVTNGFTSPIVEVVAGVLQDARGRILLTRRTEGRDLAGLWEFPGGKREPGETPEAALARELREELGIDVEVGAPLIAVPQQYPHKRLRLDVRRIESWRGTPQGREGQALAWVPQSRLARYAMPSADRPVVAALLQPDRYLVTPAPGDDEASWLQTLQRALDDGIQRIQLRASSATDPACWRALVTKLLPSTTNKFGTSWARLKRFTTERAGSLPIRMVPIRWALTPMSSTG